MMPKKNKHYNQYVEVWQGHCNSSIANYCRPRNKIYVKRKKEKPHYMQHITCSTLLIKVNKLFSFFVAMFSIRNRKHVLCVSIKFYVITQVILAFCLVLTCDLLEDRCTIDVIISKFLLCVLKWRKVLRIKIIFYMTGQKIRYKKVLSRHWTGTRSID